MINMRLLSREQAEAIVRESTSAMRLACGKADAEDLETIQEVMAGGHPAPGPMLRVVCHLLRLANIPFTFEKVPSC